MVAEDEAVYAIEEGALADAVRDELDQQGTFQAAPLPRDALPTLPAHLQHMANRPWVVAMQLRWAKQNLQEDQQEKIE